MSLPTDNFSEYNSQSLSGFSFLLGGGPNPLMQPLPTRHSYLTLTTPRPSHM